MQRERNRVITVGALILAALGLVVIGSQAGFVRQVSGLLIEPLAPVANLFTQGANTVSNIGQEDESPEALKARNDDLEHTVAGLQVEIVRLREIEQDYKRLSGLVNYSQDNPDQTLVTADVVGRDTSGYLRWVIINRGARDGIREGNPVISDLGLVGQVQDVAANASWVRLAIDPSSTINARLQNSRAEGAISGQLQGGLLMDLIPQGVVIETGDLALTSGLGGNFPSGIVIGQVISVRKQAAELFQQADVRPTVDFARLQIVSVITGFQPVQTSLFDKDIQSSGQQP
jgi:rod shape-determining protein MreC